MTLEVPFDGFVAAVKRLAPGLPAFATHENGGTRISAADPAKAIRIVAYTSDDPPVVAEALRKQGIETTEGRWIPDDAPAAAGDIHIAAIAYRTDSPQPGLWVDAYPDPPTAVQAIRTMYEEFQATGQIAEVPLEEFIRLAEPTVVVLSPSEMRGFAAAKDC